MVRPGDSSRIYSLNERIYQLGWDACLNKGPWWHLNWIDASWRAGWKDAKAKLSVDPEFANRIRTRNKRRITMAAREKAAKRTILPVFALILLSFRVAVAQTPPAPTAPLPAQLATAQKLFIGNAGDQENADCLRFYNTFYAGVQAMNQYQLVGTPEEADLVLELHYEFSLGGGVNGGSNTPRQFRVIFIDPKTHVLLWSLTERTNYAVLQKNRDKNLDETIGVLLKDFTDLANSNKPPSNRSTIHHYP